MNERSFRFLQPLRDLLHATSLDERRCILCHIPFSPAEPGELPADADNEQRMQIPLCPSCRALLRPRKGGYCPSCGELQPFSQTPSPPCARHAKKTPPPWEHFRFYGAYSGALKTLLLRGKFGADPAVLHLLGRFLALSCKDLPKPDAIVPVPLHSTRLRERGFNQCQELARPRPMPSACRSCPICCSASTPTRHQVGLSEAERVANLKSAFLSPSRKSGASASCLSTTPTRPAQPCAAPPSPCSIHMPGPPPWMWPSSPEHRAKSTTSVQLELPHTSHSPKTAENSDCGGLSCSDVP